MIILSRLNAAAPLIASLLVPLVVAVLGGYYTYSAKESENSLKYVELAVGILRAEPRYESRALRTWAVDVLANKGWTPMSAEAQAQLKSFSLPYKGGWDVTSGGN